MNYEILYIGIIIFLLIACIWYKLILLLEEEKHEKIHEDLEIMRVMYDAMKVKAKRKKELLEIQDKLIKELQNK